MCAAAQQYKARVEARDSEVHGKGVFALTDLKADDTLIEYIGEIIDWEEALRRHPHDPSQPNHTFYFHIDESRVIDANVDGNRARWINHSCDPNCEASEEGGRVFIKTLRAIAAGDELFYDYGLVIDEPMSDELKADYPCWCGAPTCRGTLLSPTPDADAFKATKTKTKSKVKATPKAGPKTKPVATK